MATTPKDNAERVELLPCPWCGAVVDHEDEWGSIIVHKESCYWTNTHGDPIGSVRVSNSEKAYWNRRDDTALRTAREEGRREGYRQAIRDGLRQLKGCAGTREAELRIHALAATGKDDNNAATTK